MKGSDATRGPAAGGPGATRRPGADAARTLGTLALLGGALPLNACVVGVALLDRRLRRRRRPARSPAPRTVLLSGGKMTKALHLARAFHRAGHRVVLAESARYRASGHRFSRAVDRFVTIPDPADAEYADALVEIVRREAVDVYVPVCSPVSAAADARARAALSEFCEVLHPDPQTLDLLDDKEHFARTATALGLAVPDSHRITNAAQVSDFDFEGGEPPYVLKSIAYDPVRRLDLTPLPRPDAADTAAFVEGLPIASDNPWVLQSFVAGQEYCTHSTVRAGEVQVHCCCESSAFQLNYAPVDAPDIEAWVRRFAAELELTGQISLDFIRGADGRAYAIECNPRTHSAITMFYDHPDLAAAYLQDGIATLRPTGASRPTYWLYHELWRALRDPVHAGAPLRRILRGKEAIFSWEDPLPFLLVHHLQIPALLLANLRRRGRWLRIDFNIGKLVEPGGD